MNVNVNVSVSVNVNGFPVRVLHQCLRMYYRNLDVYRKALNFLPIASSVADAMPPRYASLADQVRRAALSILLNIAEGSGKTSEPDKRRFYAIARGSAMECGAILDACESLNVCTGTASTEGQALLTGIVQMLTKLCRD